MIVLLRVISGVDSTGLMLKTTIPVMAPIIRNSKNTWAKPRKNVEAANLDFLKMIPTSLKDISHVHSGRFFP